MSKGKKIAKSMPFGEYCNELEKNTNKTRVVYANDFYEELDDKAFKSLLYRTIFNRLMNILLKVFKWTVPDYLVPRAIELGLINSGFAVGFDCKLGKYVLPCNPVGRKTIYDEFRYVRAYTFNGQNFTVEIEQDYKELKKGFLESVLYRPEGRGLLLRDNDMDYPIIETVKFYSHALMDAWMATHVSSQRLKSPYYFVINSKEAGATKKDIVDSIKRNEDVVIEIKPKVMEGKSIEDIVGLYENKMNPAIIQEQKGYFEWVFDQFLGMVGINNNPSPDKSQYVNNEELTTNNGLIKIEQSVRLENRKKFAEELSKYFEDEIKVELATEELEKEIMKMKQEMMGGNNGQENGNNTETKQ